MPPGPDPGRLDHFSPGSGPVTPMLTVRPGREPVASHRTSSTTHPRCSAAPAGRIGATGSRRVRRVGIVVEQRDKVVALTDSHRLHPAEDLHRVTGRDDSGAVQLAHLHLPATSAPAHLVHVAGAHVTQRQSFARAERTPPRAPNAPPAATARPATARPRAATSRARQGSRAARPSCASRCRGAGRDRPRHPVR